MSPVQLFLNQRQADTLSRHYHYVDYLFAARRERMRHYLEAVDRLRTVEAELAAAMAGLQADQAGLEAGHAELLGRRQERQVLLASLEADLKRKGSELRELEADRAALQKVIDEIEAQRQLAIAEEARRREAEAAEQERQRLEQARREQERQAQQAAVPPSIEPAPAADPPPAAQPVAPSARRASPAWSSEDLARLQAQSFDQRKGSLRWPVAGRVANRFGEPRQGSIQWDGLRIAAAAGTEVRAVHYGRVMYADWLRGQGLLIILDHGEGYMSLYAHNDVLLHEPGEWVQAGEPLARVGNSGGEKEAGLYFEIRKDGEPVDPQRWLGKP